MDINPFPTMKFQLAIGDLTVIKTGPHNVIAEMLKISSYCCYVWHMKVFVWHTAILKHAHLCAKVANIFALRCIIENEKLQSKNKINVHNDIFQM